MTLNRYILLTVAVLCTSFCSLAQTAEEQKKVIASLEQSIAKEEKALNSIKKDKGNAEKRVKSLSKQINKRKTLIKAANQRLKALEKDIKISSRRIETLSSQLEKLELSSTRIIREAYRNYRFHSFLSYLIHSSSATEMAHRLSSLRAAQEKRTEQISKIYSLRTDVKKERDVLTKKRDEQEEAKKILDQQQQRLNADIAEARKELKKMSQKEKEHMQVRLEQQSRLEKAIEKLRKLTKGNTYGKSFSSKKGKLPLPVAGGWVKRFKKNTAEINGPENAAVISVYEGKVVDVKANKINGKYDVYIAHGEYISSYANLSSVFVTKNQTVVAGGKIGIIGSSVNLQTMETEYKILFGLYPPSASISIDLSKYF